jgi:hypothetical protein
MVQPQDSPLDHDVRRLNELHGPMPRIQVLDTSGSVAVSNIISFTIDFLLLL